MYAHVGVQGVCTKELSRLTSELGRAEALPMQQGGHGGHLFSCLAP